MNNQTLEKLLGMMPEGKSKDKLIKMKRQLEKRNSGGGLHDDFAMKPEGHIQIESIDDSGNVVDVLANQKNLVVDGAEEILLRAFSGDPNRILYKNRIPKNETTNIYHVPTEAIIQVENDQNIIVNHPNDLWRVVDDEDFDIEFAYYPNTVYVKEEVSQEPHYKAFSVHTSPNAETAPLSAEVYSTFSNLFIGLGDGENYVVPFDDNRLNVNGFTGNDVKVAEAANAEISFEEKISNFVVSYRKHNKGSKLGVFVNDVQVDEIDTKDDSLGDGQGEVVNVSYKTNNEEVSKVSLKVLDDVEADHYVEINSLKFDAFQKTDNGLIHEFENFTNKFITPTAYNTTTNAPYTITLANSPVKEGTIEITYNDAVLEEVNSQDEVSEGKYFVNYLNGIVHFNRSMTSLMVSCETTGEISQDERVSNLNSQNATISVTGETPEGEVDGQNRDFYFIHSNSQEVFKVLLNDEEIPEGTTGRTYRKYTNYIRFNFTPEEGAKITIDYSFRKSVLVLNTEFMINSDKGLKLIADNETELSLGNDVNSLVKDEMFVIDTSDENNKTILMTPQLLNENTYTNVELFYYSDERPGVPTNYTRQVILKPKDINEYPWYSLDKGNIQFVAEFAEDAPNNSVTIREMGLFDGPRLDDKVKGFSGYPVKAFSLVRVGEARKDTSTGLRVTWTITLTNEDGKPFEGGK